MFKGILSAPDGGGPIVVVGLTPRNLELLQEDKPVYVSFDELMAEGGPLPVAYAGGSVLVMFGASEIEIANQLRRVVEGKGGKETGPTEVKALYRGDITEAMATKVRNFLRAVDEGDEKGKEAIIEDLRMLDVNLREWDG